MPSPQLYALSLPDALPILAVRGHGGASLVWANIVRSAVRSIGAMLVVSPRDWIQPCRISWAKTREILAFGLPNGVATMASFAADRKSTRLNSSHLGISYAVPAAVRPFPTRRSSDLGGARPRRRITRVGQHRALGGALYRGDAGRVAARLDPALPHQLGEDARDSRLRAAQRRGHHGQLRRRSEEHTSELQSLRHLVCRPRSCTPFPYPTLFRSWRCAATAAHHSCGPTSCARRCALSGRCWSCRRATGSSPAASAGRRRARFSPSGCPTAWPPWPASPQIGRAHV